MVDGTFFQLRLIGNRFSNHSIPVDVLAGIIPLKDLVLEAAKLEYLNDHPDRRRVPRGFGNAVELKLASIERGSAQLRIDMELPPSLSGVVDQHSYFESGLTRVIHTIRNAGDNSSTGGIDVSNRMLGRLDQIAKHIREGEAIDFVSMSNDDCGGDVARFTRHTAKVLRTKLVGRSETVRQLEIRGSIPRLDQERRTLQIRTADGNKINTSVSPELLDSVLQIFSGYKQGVRAYFRGTGRINSAGNILEFGSISELNIIENRLDIGIQIDDLRALKDGWLDGEGQALSRDGLDWLESTLRTSFPSDLPPPYLYPTATAGVQIEWSIGFNSVSLEICLASQTGIWHQLNLRSDEELERDLNLSEAAAWEWLIQQINCLVREQ